MKTCIVLSSMFFVAVLFLAWDLAKTKRELEQEKARPSWAQFERPHFSLEPTQHPEKLEATVIAPYCIPDEIVEEELANKLSRALPMFWTIKKDRDVNEEFHTADVRYRAYLWVVTKEDET